MKLFLLNAYTLVMAVLVGLVLSATIFCGIHHTLMVMGVLK